VSWFDADYPLRIPIAVDNNGGAASIDASVVLPVEWEAFWGAIDADGHELRVTDSNGRTAVTWKRGNWTYASRLAQIDVNAWSPASDDATVILWLYWGNSGATDGAGTFTPSSAKTGKVTPFGPAAGDIVIRGGPLPAGTDNPPTVYGWQPGREGWVWFQGDHLLHRLPEKFNGRPNLEEVAAINVATRNGGSAYADGNAPSKTRFVELADGRQLVGMWLEGGADGQTYIDEVTVTTTLNRVLVMAAQRNANTAEEA